MTDDGGDTVGEVDDGAEDTVVSSSLECVEFRFSRDAFQAEQLLATMERIIGLDSLNTGCFSRLHVESYGHTMPAPDEQVTVIVHRPAATEESE